MKDLREIAADLVNIAKDFGASYADSRVDRNLSTMIRYVHDGFEQASTGINQVLGLRVHRGGSWGFASGTRFDKESLRDSALAAVRASKVASHRSRISLPKPGPASREFSNRSIRSSQGIRVNTETQLCEALVKAARAYDRRIRSAVGFCRTRRGSRAIANSDGTCIQLEDNRLYYSVRAFATRGERTVTALENHGVTQSRDPELKTDPTETAREAAHRALFALRARQSLKTRVPIVIDPKLCGLLVHETIGHAVEADSLDAGTSFLENKIGQHFGTKQLTIYDDPTLLGSWGEMTFDDEGTLAKKKVLVHSGILEDIILDKQCAMKFGKDPNGGGRAESAAYPPLPRMSNTFLGAGEYSFEELIEDMQTGILFRGTTGGEVDSTEGTFSLNAETAQRIDKGELTAPLSQQSISGLATRTLNCIEAIGKDVEYHAGFCEKEGQEIPVGSGGPYIRIGRRGAITA